MCAFVFTKSMVIGVKSFICTYFLHEPNNCEKCQANKFQFQIGAIRRQAVVNGIKAIVCFNSKLVRLEGRLSMPTWVLVAGFQFQIGAIRSFMRIFHAMHTKRFQFQIGAIRRQRYVMITRF